jgi:hypothetical protein
MAPIVINVTIDSHVALALSVGALALTIGAILALAVAGAQASAVRVADDMIAELLNPKRSKTPSALAGMLSSTMTDPQVQNAIIATAHKLATDEQARVVGRLRFISSGFASLWLVVRSMRNAT